MSTMARRKFLVLAANTAALALAGCRPAARTHPASSQPATPLATGEPPPATPALVKGLHLTPVGDFYVQSYADTPGAVDLKAYRFVLDGLVEQPLSLTYDELRSLPAVEGMWTMVCIGNPVGGYLIGNQVWKGTHLSSLLERAGVKPNATRARFDALDHYSNSIDINRLRQPDTLLVYEMAGQPLPPDHGYPLRILIPGHYGQKQPKWLTRIELIDHPYQGYWEQKGWSDTALIQINSRLDRLPDKLTTAQAVRISGVALGRETGVKRVEVGLQAPNAVSPDWREAELIRPPTPLAWTEWSCAWTPTEAGLWTVSARATDNDGAMQAGFANDFFGAPFPDGTSAIQHEVIPITG